VSTRNQSICLWSGYAFFVFYLLDIVVANAGILPFAAQAGRRAFADAIDILLTRVYNTVEVAVPHVLAKGESGSIVLTSSANGLKGLPNGAPGVLGYGAAKTALIGLMRHWALLLGPKNIRVNTIHPTGVNTGMVVNDEFSQWVTEYPVVAEYMQNVLSVDLIEPEDVSEAILFLVSPAGRFVTGQSLAIDAGITL
jgi:NAD(P)-dependent dehydrogenase (short-subunit alcohol dehydrogenase family)